MWHVDILLVLTCNLRFLSLSYILFNIYIKDGGSGAREQFGCGEATQGVGETETVDAERRRGDFIDETTTTEENGANRGEV